MLMPATPTLDDRRSAIGLAQKLLPRQAGNYGSGGIITPPATKVVNGVAIERPLTMAEADVEVQALVQKYLERGWAATESDALRKVCHESHHHHAEEGSSRLLRDLAAGVATLPVSSRSVFTITVRVT